MLPKPFKKFPTWIFIPFLCLLLIFSVEYRVHQQNSCGRDVLHLEVQIEILQHKLSRYEPVPQLSSGAIDPSMSKLSLLNKLREMRDEL